MADLTEDQISSIAYSNFQKKELKEHDPLCYKYTNPLLKALDLDSNKYTIFHFTDFEFNINQIDNSSLSIRISDYDEHLQIFMMDSISGDDELELFQMKEDLFNDLKAKLPDLYKDEKVFDIVKRANLVEFDPNGLEKTKLKNYYKNNDNEEPLYEKPSEIFSKYSLNYSLSLTLNKSKKDIFYIYSQAFFIEKYGFKLNDDDFLFLNNITDYHIHYSYFHSIVVQQLNEDKEFFKFISFDKNNRLTEESKELLTLNYKV